jgi:hypothetical protein
MHSLALEVFCPGATFLSLVICFTRRVGFFGIGFLGKRVVLVGRSFRHGALKSATHQPTKEQEGWLRKAI